MCQSQSYVLSVLRRTLNPTNVGASIANAPDRGTDVTHDTDPATDDATPAGSDALGWLPERVELSSDEWVIYPPGEPQPTSSTLRFERAVPTVLVGIDSGDSSGVYVLPHPDGLSVSARFGSVVDDSVRELEPSPSNAKREAAAARTRTWVERVSGRAKRTRIRTACAPVLNTGDRVSGALFDHFGSTDAVMTAVFERGTATLTWASDVTERTATDLAVHYDTDVKWERCHRHRDTVP